ncbi:hypothetical protein AB0N17_08635 [Streptomyces sp. NPDC051133]|uniref:hypothetical protein n=1 Tax=Streptomyces sp. NPDC051133 TaxID=3155521 RepID=UPI003434119E
MRHAWVLRTRGITVEGRLVSSYVDSTENGLVTAMLVAGAVLLLVFGLPVVLAGVVMAAFAVALLFL